MQSMDSWIVSSRSTCIKCHSRQLPTCARLRPCSCSMGLWSDLFRRAALDDGALLTPGRSYPVEGAPNFPDLGHSLQVSNGEPLRLSTVVGAGKPTIALIYSNCWSPSPSSSPLTMILTPYPRFTQMRGRRLSEPREARAAIRSLRQLRGRVC